MNAVNANNAVRREKCALRYRMVRKDAESEKVNNSSCVLYLVTLNRVYTTYNFDVFIPIAGII